MTISQYFFLSSSYQSTQLTNFFYSLFRKYPHELSENFIASEKDILETWLKSIGEKDLPVKHNLVSDKSEL